MSTVCESCSYGLVKDLKNVQWLAILKSNVFACGSCCVSCGILEVSRAGDDYALDLLVSEMLLSIVNELLEDSCGNCRGGILVVAKLERIVLTHEVLCAFDHKIGVHCAFLSCSRADNHITVACIKVNNGRCCLCSFGRVDCAKLTVFIDVAYAGIGCTEVDTEFLSHDKISPLFYVYSF